MCATGAVRLGVVECLCHKATSFELEYRSDAMLLPALHLLKLADPTEVKRDLDDFWGSDDDEETETKEGNTKLKYDKEDDFWGSDNSEGEGEETDEVPKDADDYEEPEYPKILILDFDCTMHNGTVMKYVTSTYASMANKNKTEEEENKYHSELARDADNVKQGNYARVAVGGMTAENPLFEKLTQEEYVELFGGQEEIKRMQEFFNNLDNQWVDRAILTFAPEAAVIKALEAVDLIKWFTDEGAEPGNKVYGKKFFDSAEKIMKEEEGAGVDKSAGVAIFLDNWFEANKEDLPENKRSEVTVVYVDDDYQNVTGDGSGVVPVVFKDPDYNLYKSTGIVHKWDDMESQKKKDQMNSIPLPFSSDFEDIEIALDLEGWVKELASKDLENISNWWNTVNDDGEPMTPSDIKYQYEEGGRKAKLQWCQRARALYWEELDGSKFTID